MSQHRLLLYLIFVISSAIPAHSLNFIVEQVTNNSTQDWFSTIAVDASNKVHISYRHIDETGGDSEIYYVSNISGTWVSERITDNNVNDYSSNIAVIPLGRPFIGYIGDNESEVYYAKKITGNWIIDPITGNNNYKVGTSIIVVDDSIPHLAYYQLTSDAPNIYYATLIYDGWRIDSTPNSDSAMPFAPSLAIDADRKAHISFGQILGGNPDVYYATNKTGIWQTINVTNDSAVDHRSSLALDDNGFVHLVFRKDDELYYGNNRSGSFLFERVTNNSVTEISPSLCIDINCKAHIVAHERPYAGNIYYYTNVSGIWKKVPVYEQKGNKILSLRNIAIDHDGYAHVTFCATDSTGGASTAEVYHAVTDSIVVGIEEKNPSISNRLGLLQVLPNPTAGPVVIRYVAPIQPKLLHLSIYNAIGQMVKSFSLPVGSLPSIIYWDGTDNSNRRITPGVYFCCCQSGEFQIVREFVVIK